MLLAERKKLQRGKVWENVAWRADLPHVEQGKWVIISYPDFKQD